MARRKMGQGSAFRVLFGRANQIMWTCPDCAFSFAAELTDPDGSYTCPCCAEAALTAERDAARADRVCWRETHNQVAAERDALAAVVRKAISAHPLSGADPQGRGCWFRHFTAEDGHPSLAVITLSDAEHDAIRRALDASPTEGNPE